MYFNYNKSFAIVFIEFDMILTLLEIEKDLIIMYRENKYMNIAFIGVGGVGGYFGGKMAQLLKDTSVDFNLYFVARGAHLEQIRKNGLKLKTSDNGEMICNPTLATNNINDLPQLDVCFICVK